VTVVYIARRLLVLIPTLFGMVLAVFLLVHAAPGDPIMLLFDVNVEQVSQEQIDRLRAQHGLDRPLHEQFVAYVGRVLQGDLGRSIRANAPVIDEIRRNVRPTLELALSGLLVGLLIGVSAGVLAAMWPNSVIDYTVLTSAILGLAAPNFWLGIILLYVFSFQLGWFPIAGEGSGDLVSTVRHLTLPAFVVGTSMAALIARLTRSAMLEVLGLDFIRTARAKGLQPAVVVLKHAFRNAAIPIVTATSALTAFLFTGSVIVEVVFSRRGLGALIVTAINARDFPLVQGLILLFGTTIVLFNLFGDLVCGWLDPRVTYA
jgi:peptide/nickel transport system permease protein